MDDHSHVPNQLFLSLYFPKLSVQHHVSQRKSYAALTVPYLHFLHQFGYCHLTSDTNSLSNCFFHLLNVIGNVFCHLIAELLALDRFQS
jgi:hypothetical protein